MLSFWPSEAKMSVLRSGRDPCQNDDLVEVATIRLDSYPVRSVSTATQSADASVIAATDSPWASRTQKSLVIRANDRGTPRAPVLQIKLLAVYPPWSNPG